MKKTVVWILCLLTLFLSACGNRSVGLTYAEKCMERLDLDSSDVDEVYIMHYTSRTRLSDEVLDTDMYQEIPDSGYVVLLHSYGTPAFYDSYACFLNENGRIVFTFDYEENDRLFEKYYSNFSVSNVSAGERALEYLKNCNYISHMINNAGNAQLKGDMEKNVWYALSDKQIRKLS